MKYTLNVTAYRSDNIYIYIYSDIIYVHNSFFNLLLYYFSEVLMQELQSSLQEDQQEELIPMRSPGLTLLYCYMH